MRKIFLIACLSLVQLSYAQPPAAKIEVPPEPTFWSSKNSNDIVTINNGNANHLTITINVDKNPIAGNNVPGVTINNCGDTKHIDAGSSAVCSTNDPANPVNFSSDNATSAASGTYIIKQN